MGFVISISFVILVVSIVHTLSIGLEEEDNEGTESSNEAVNGLEAIIEDCLNPNITEDELDFRFGLNMTRTQNCVMACVFKKAEVISEDNKLIRHGVDKWNDFFTDHDNDDNERNLSNEDITFKCTNDDIFQKCSDITDEDECVATYKIINCAVETCGIAGMETSN